MSRCVEVGYIFRVTRTHAGAETFDLLNAKSWKQDKNDRVISALNFRCSAAFSNMQLKVGQDIVAEFDSASTSAIDVASQVRQVSIKVPANSVLSMPVVVTGAATSDAELVITT